MIQRSLLSSFHHSFKRYMRIEGPRFFGCCWVECLRTTERNKLINFHRSNIQQESCTEMNSRLHSIKILNCKETTCTRSLLKAEAETRKQDEEVSLHFSFAFMLKTLIKNTENYVAVVGSWVKSKKPAMFHLQLNPQPPLDILHKVILIKMT